MFIKIPSACLTIVPRPIKWTQLLTAGKPGFEGLSDNNRRAKVQLFILPQGCNTYFFTLNHLKIIQSRLLEPGLRLIVC